MAIGSLGGRSSRGRRVVRPSRWAASKEEPDAAAAAAAATPDIDHVREKRLGYYGVSASERRRVSSPSSTKPTSKSTRIPSTTKAAAGEHSRRRKHRSASAASKNPTSTSRSRSAEYVYATEGTSPGADAGVRSQSSSERRPRHSNSSSRRQPPVIIEHELTADDSVSRVGRAPPVERRNSTEPSRSSSRRDGATITKLPTSTQSKGDSKAAMPSPKKSSRPGSTPSLRGIWRRNSVASAPPPPRLVECLTCASADVPHFRSAKLACGHRMCHGCLKKVFEMSVKDPTHMPPRCCTNDHIPLKHVDHLFDLKFKMLWNRKYQEYHTKNRIYCPNAKCGEWIKPKHFRRSGGRKYAQCPKCTAKACTLCNGKVHKSRDCPKDPEIAALLEQAKEKGWQSCYSCHAMVELKEGCNHMTCRCTAEFCMICGSKWKTCDCPWFNSAQVPEPIPPILERVMGAAGIPPPPRPQNQRPARQETYWIPTYQDELDQRRRQEYLDEHLARRIQLASLFEPEDAPPNRHRDADVQPWRFENETGHFMNHDFVQTAVDVVMSAFGEATMGRRGERSSGWRRRSRQVQAEQGGGRRVPDFLGHERALGAARR